MSGARGDLSKWSFIQLPFRDDFCLASADPFASMKQGLKKEKS
jgi:hypothetical protein